MSQQVEDWNKMPQWMKDIVCEAVFVAKYVEVRHPEIYAAAKEEDRFLQWRQKIAKVCTHPKGFASGCRFEPSCDNFLYKDEEEC